MFQKTIDKQKLKNGTLRLLSAKKKFNHEKQ